MSYYSRNNTATAADTPAAVFPSQPNVEEILRGLIRPQTVFALDQAAVMHALQARDFHTQQLEREVATLRYEIDTAANRVLPRRSRAPLRDDDRRRRG